MAKFNGNDFHWDDFCKGFLNGGYYEFLYNDIVINVGLESKGTYRKVNKWIFIVHNNEGSNKLMIYSEYLTGELLLENARINAESLKDIWDELILD